MTAAADRPAAEPPVPDRSAEAPRGAERRWARTVLALVAVAALAASGLSAYELRLLHDRVGRSDRNVVTGLEVERSLDATTADLEGRILALGADARAHLGEADHIDEVAADIVTTRGEIDRLVAAIARTSADRAVRQTRIDLLLGCRDTLAAAATQLGDDATEPGVAVATLDAGRAQCQAALAQVQGDTGAVHPYDFADPSIQLVGDTYYAYGTEGPGGPIQAMASKDLRSWTVLPNALANFAAWAKPGTAWAPTVSSIGGRYVLYYATRSKASGHLCISSAVGLAPAGPFLDNSLVPLVCQDDLGGSIDPSVYLDELGFAHLTWKSEDDTKGGRAQLWSQFLGPDGRSLAGAPVVLLRSDERWEDDTIENPMMTIIDGVWILLYSGNRWNTVDYAIGYAVCESSTGPCRRRPTSRVLGSTATFQGPGGASTVRTRGGRLVVAYAAWDTGNVGYPNPRRLHVATVRFRDDRLALAEL